jgi:hypothetical protein
MGGHLLYRRARRARRHGPKKAKKKPTDVSLKDFLGQHWHALNEAEKFERRKHNALLFPPATRPESFPDYTLFSLESWDHARRLWLPVMLREAAEKNDAEGYKRLLYVFLIKLAAEPPAGVLSQFRWPPGRPNSTRMIYEDWVAGDRPPLKKWEDCLPLIKSHYPPEEVAKAEEGDRDMQRTLMDRLQETIERHESHEPKPPKSKTQ